MNRSDAEYLLRLMARMGMNEIDACKVLHVMERESQRGDEEVRTGSVVRESRGVHQSPLSLRPLHGGESGGFEAPPDARDQGQERRTYASDPQAQEDAQGR